jgi:hypothetical protein
LLIAVTCGATLLEVAMLSTGTWSDNVIVDVDYDGVSDGESFNLTITDLATVTVETFDDVTIDDTKSNFVESVVNDEDSGSKLISVSNREESTCATGLGRRHHAGQHQNVDPRSSSCSITP